MSIIDDLSASLEGDAPLAPRAGHLRDCGALELAQYARSESLLEASIGMAAVNSLMEIDESGCVELNAGEVILKERAGRRVAIVGHFPFIHPSPDGATPSFIGSRLLSREAAPTAGKPGGRRYRRRGGQG